jgi:hypothetical protein
VSVGFASVAASSRRGRPSSDGPRPRFWKNVARDDAGGPRAVFSARARGGAHTILTAGVRADRGVRGRRGGAHTMLRGTRASAWPLLVLTPAAKPTADQMRVLKILEQLDGAADWRGVTAQERV